MLDREQQNRYYQRCIDRWQEDPPALTAPIIAELAQLHPHKFLSRWTATLANNGRVISLTLIDLKGEGHDQLLVACHNGYIFSFDALPVDGAWEAHAATQIPPELGTLVGILPQVALFDQAPAVHAIIRHQEHDIRYELHHNPRNGLQYTELPQRRSPYRRLLLSQQFGRQVSDGLMFAALVSHDGTPCLLGAPYPGQPHLMPLAAWPTALVYSARHAWVGDSHERLWCWAWHEGRWHLHAPWPAGGLDLDGQITALALWPAGEEDAWLLLAATDDRSLYVIDPAGNIHEQIETRQTITALAAPANPAGNDAGPFLYVAFEDGHIECQQPIWPPLAQPPFPTLPTALRRLPAENQIKVLHNLARATPEEDTAKIVGGLLDALLQLDPAGDDALLNALLPGDDHTLPVHVRPHILRTLETHALKADSATHPFVCHSLRLARQWQPHISIYLSYLVDRLVGRLAARFRNDIKQNEDYIALSRERKQGDHTLADSYLGSGKVRSRSDYLLGGLQRYARMLLDRHQSRWLFATNRAIRTIAPLKDSAQLLLTTRSGRIYHLDLTVPHLAEDCLLEGGIQARALAVGHLLAADKQAIAVATMDGQVYIGPAPPDGELAQLETVYQAGRDVWSIAILPRDQVTAPSLVLSYGQSGLISIISQTANGWQEENQLRLQADWIHTLCTSTMVA